MASYPNPDRPAGRSEDVLRRALRATEAAAALSSDEAPQARRQRVAASLMAAEQAGVCIRPAMALPDATRHDVEVALAELAIANGWHIPSTWTDPCVEALRAGASQ